MLDTIFVWAKRSLEVHSVWFITVFWFSLRVQNPNFPQNFQGLQPLIWLLFLTNKNTLESTVFIQLLSLHVFSSLPGAGHSNKYWQIVKIVTSFWLEIRPYFWKFLSLTYKPLFCPEASGFRPWYPYFPQNLQGLPV